MTQSFETLRHRARHGLAITLTAGFLVTSSGCGALLQIGAGDKSAIAFATGELRATEKAALAEVDIACSQAIERMGYEDVELLIETDRFRYRARTVGGEPVDIQALAAGPEMTELRIRIGVFGDETTSRLVLEEIQQSL